jgi:hypothetical protein
MKEGVLEMFEEGLWVNRLFKLREGKLQYFTEVSFLFIFIISITFHKHILPSGRVKVIGILSG